jgi:hypothetical protein
VEAQGKARVIAINNSWRLAPWADVLYACDHRWWAHFNGVPDFHGLKVSQDEQIERQPWGVNRVYVERNKDVLLLSKFGTIGWGGNSGFHALNLAVQFGAVKIILVGYDMRMDKGIHWHGPHPREMNNPTPGNIARWCRAVDSTAPVLDALGIDCINTCMHSSLKNFPKMPFAEALAECC